MNLGVRSVEVVVGATLVAGGITSPVGAAMIVHGGANLAAAISSKIAYETTDGNTELSTSALGLVSQGGAYLIFRDEGHSKEAASDQAAMIGSLADAVDGIGSLAMNPANTAAAAGAVSKVSGVVNALGDIALVGATAQDTSKNYSDRKEAERKSEIQRIESEGL